MLRGRIVAFAAVTGTLAASGGSWGQCAELQKLLASDGTSRDVFGDDVAISGDVAIVGAGSDDDRGQYSGSAYVYRFDGAAWVEEQKLLASDAAVDARFGDDVAISGDVAIAGARGDDDLGDESGAAYVYRFDGFSWVEEQKLLASDGTSGDAFGHSVSMSGDVAMVGAFGDDDVAHDSGAVYVYRFDGVSWVEEQKLHASDGASGDGLGFSVSISGDAAIVAALGDLFHGSAYVYRLVDAAWVEQGILASGEEGDDLFGVSVSISGNVAIVGAAWDHESGRDSGCAYVYRFDGVSWVKERKLLASDAAERDFFGSSVSISGDTAIVGAPKDDDRGSDSGSAYVYRFDGASWIEEQKLLASDAAEEDRLGGSVSISGDMGIVGAIGDNDRGQYAGSAYLFDLFLCLCLADVDGNGTVNSADLQAILTAWGDCHGCPEDLDGNDVVDMREILMLLPAWGPCTQLPPIFGDDVRYAAGDGARSVAAGDLDSDLDLDLVVANANSDDVSVLLNNGDGTFAVQACFGAGDRPLSVAVADLDGDLDLDLAVANRWSNDVSVLLNEGDGTFVHHVRYGAGADPLSVAVGDLDGDDDLDLAVANYGSNNISVLLNNGDGTFAPQFRYPAGNGPHSVVAGDLDGGLGLDLAVANSDSDDVSVLLNNGDATFAAAIGYGAGDYPYFVAAGDLDGDLLLDLAVANSDSDDVSVLLNNGDGTFAARVHYGAGAKPLSVAVGDLDGDLGLDLIVANYDGDDISVLLNNGDGTFATHGRYGVGDRPLCFAVGDLDEDLDLDLAVANYGSDDVSVLLNNCERPDPCPADVNGDRAVGLSDVLIVLAFWGDCPCICLGDIDGDGTVDFGDLLAVLAAWGPCPE